jgi:ABC-type microcin C transport system duplicated ATPase subunit YejF
LRGYTSFSYVLLESGSGKSVGALVMRLVSDVNGRIDGNILLEGQDLSALDEEGMRQIRGNRISTIFQEPTDQPQSGSDSLADRSARRWSTTVA